MLDLPKVPIACPDCRHGEAQIIVLAMTVMTVRCVECGHEWAVEIRDTPAEVRRTVSYLRAS